MYLLLPYQQRWIADRSKVKICVKSRRIGITWASAANSTLEAAEGVQDTWYIGYEEGQALEFIRDCELHCRAFLLVHEKGERQRVYLDDEGNTVPAAQVDESNILAYRITFRSGKRITALTSRPRNLRGKQGRVILDEAAFHDCLPELLKAAMALLMWGGCVEIISTHDGVDNDFNKLLEQVEAGKLNYSLHKITLDDALAEGLYQRICQVSGDAWSLEIQDEWRRELIASYGVGAGEELFCEPLSLVQGQMFNRVWFDTIDTMPGVRELGMAVRFWDLASTAKRKGNDPDYTACVHMVEYGDKHIITDAVFVHEDPGGVEALIKRIAEQDGRRCPIAMEQEPGSSGKLYTNHVKKNILGLYQFSGIPSTGDKVTRAKPLSTAAKQGNILLRKGPWNGDFLDILHKFPFGRYDDPVDASSGAYNYLKGDGTMNALIKAMRNK